MFDDFTELFKRLKKPSKKSDFYDMIIFYAKIRKLFNIYEKDMKVIEINPNLEDLKKDKFALDYINFIVIIKNDEYLLFMVMDKPESLKKEDLNRFNEIFHRQSKKKGIFIAYNDNELNSNLLLSVELYSIKRNLPAVFQSIKSNYKPLKVLIDKIITEPDYDLKKLFLNQKRRDDIIDKFHNNLKFVINDKKERVRDDDKKQFLLDFDSVKISNLLNVLEEFLEEGIKKKKIKQFYKDFI